jgi:hypothetical protein
MEEIMKMLRASFVLVFISIVSIGSSQVNSSGRFHAIDRMPVPLLKHPRGLAKVSAGSFYKSKCSWQHIIDSSWGPGLPLAQKLQIYSVYTSTLQQKFDGFQSLGINWDSLKSHYLALIDSSTSRGGFAGIMSALSRSLRDGHTSAFDNRVFDTPLAPGVPILVLSQYADAAHFGAVLTALPDSTALVLRTVPDHPLGLEPGDIVLGYEGIPWKSLFKELMAAGLPVNGLGVGSRSAEIHSYIRNVGNNWHLFETIDIVKHATGDTLHLPVTPLLNLPDDAMLANEQLAIPGIPFPDYFADHNVSYGVLQGTNIGYIYLFSEWPFSTIDLQFRVAVGALLHTDGLIIDMRWNDGGWALFKDAFGLLFSRHYFTIEDAYRASPSTFELAPAGNASVNEIQGNPGSLYSHPIAVLLGPTCGSEGEVVAQRLRYHPMVRFFGRPTYATYGDNAFVSGVQEWDLRYSLSDMFHTQGPGVYLNRSEFPIDEPVWFNADDVANGKDPVVQRALQWMNGLSYPHSVSVNPTYVAPGQDSIVATTVWTNPGSHVVNASLSMTTLNNTFQDSAAMVNDGMHGDGLPGDSIWGARLRTPSTEDFYVLSLRASDQTSSSSRLLPAVALFTTAGPVVCAGDTTNARPEWGLTVRLRMKVGNNGMNTVTPAVEGRIRSLDTAATVVSGNPIAVGDVLPGEVRLSSVAEISFSRWCHGIRNIAFEVVFSSNGVQYWRDTITILVADPTGIAHGEMVVPTTYELGQNYPNPFNPTTSIRYAVGAIGSQRTVVSMVRLAVYDLLGREVKLLMDERKEPGRYEVMWDASGCASGVYICRMTAGQFVQSRTMVLLK